ncbi:MAG TPA: hypothetical protein PLV39_14745 [Fimbriimonadaceae bacterium]|jgi:hypothetical protein|nr:hypothetical protein [Fimbriimonadaceae bacterium]
MALAATNPITGQPYRRGYNPGAESGAIVFEVEQRRDRVLVASVRSFTQAGVRYTIEVNCRTGQCRCSCQACQQAIKRAGCYPSLQAERGYCKHISAWWAELASEVIAINAEASR